MCTTTCLLCVLNWLIFWKVSGIFQGRGVKRDFKFFLLISLLLLLFLSQFLYWLLFDDEFFHKVFNKDTNNKSTPSNNQCKGLEALPENVTFFKCLVFLVQHFRLSFIIVIIKTRIRLSYGHLMRASSTKSGCEL